jgi:hypothetical protein
MFWRATHPNVTNTLADSSARAAVAKACQLKEKRH